MKHPQHFHAIWQKMIVDGVIAFGQAPHAGLKLITLRANARLLNKSHPSLFQALPVLDGCLYVVLRYTFENLSNVELGWSGEYDSAHSLLPF
jgi:hypothetical protein